MGTSILTKGWLNVKWRCDIQPDSRSVFVKYYHPDRYKLHLPERRAKIERTLFLQQRLHEQGFTCPRVYEGNGAYIQETPSGFLFAMMDWVQGNVREAGKMSRSDMYDFGQKTGRMHQLLCDEELDASAWHPNQTACLADLQSNLKQARDEQCHPLIELLEQAIHHVEMLDFRIFEESRIGWTHWDLWADNVIVDENKIAGIVDFDRMAVAYPEIDVARAILSGAFDAGGIRVDAVQAFIAGYREHMEVPTGLILRSFKMLYLIESIWWLRTPVLRDTAVPKRFLEEMIWLTQHWDELPYLFSDY
ncbi:homoserine kinase type II [Paenibacillus qinlingensis]|uniref:Homoserine kinase type II n=1 Tax=Paenibacillus qinlingensis TaxID=1837343 RepID=A0ABU1NR03_9BACL|nr:homoserine kinase type II [Paenibacillus qinlingensis]